MVPWEGSIEVEVFLCFENVDESPKGMLHNKRL